MWAPRHLPGNTQKPHSTQLQSGHWPQQPVMLSRRQGQDCSSLCPSRATQGGGSTSEHSLRWGDRMPRTLPSALTYPAWSTGGLCPHCLPQLCPCPGDPLMLGNTHCAMGNSKVLDPMVDTPRLRSPEPGKHPMGCQVTWAKDPGMASGDRGPQHLWAGGGSALGSSSSHQPSCLLLGPCHAWPRLITPGRSWFAAKEEEGRSSLLLHPRGLACEPCPGPLLVLPAPLPRDLRARVISAITANSHVSLARRA